MLDTFKLPIVGAGHHLVLRVRRFRQKFALGRGHALLLSGLSAHVVVDSHVLWLYQGRAADQAGLDVPRITSLGSIGAGTEFVCPSLRFPLHSTRASNTCALPVASNAKA